MIWVLIEGAIGASTVLGLVYFAQWLAEIALN
jgi:hypothetical protein